MQIRDTARHYGIVTRWLHWLTAAGIAVMLAIGWGAELLPDAAEGSLMGVHIGLGIAVLGLGLARIAWRVVNRRRPSRPTGPQGWMATAVQWALVALLVIVPLSGWLLLSAEGHAPSFFGLFSLPRLVGAGEGIEEFAEEAHEVLPWVLLGVLALHVLGALKHHIVDGDDTLRRMVRGTGAAVKAAGGRVRPL